MLDRALDVAAALEVRGYGAARQRARSGRAINRAWSRHDVAFAELGRRWCCALAVPSRVLGWAAFAAYPTVA